MLNVIVWITLGALAAWVVNLLRIARSPQSPYVNVAASIAGAVIGGSLAHHLGYGGSRIEEVLAVRPVLLAMAGALILRLAMNLFQPWRQAPQ